MNLESRSCELLWMCGGADGRMPLWCGPRVGSVTCARECAWAGALRLSEASTVSSPSKLVVSRSDASSLVLRYEECSRV